MSTAAWVVIGVLEALVLALAYLAGMKSGAAAIYEWLRTERMQQEVNQEVLATVRQMQTTYEQTMDEIVGHGVEAQPVSPSVAPPPVRPRYQVVVERPAAEGYGWVAGWSES